MNGQKIIEMAKEAGLTVTYIGDPIGLSYAQIAHFAKLVEDKARQELREEIIYTWVPPHFVDLAVETEREACAVIAEEWFCGCGRGSCPEGDRRAHDIADSIRARDAE
jgi:hypothetical protein